MKKPVVTSTSNKNKFNTKQYQRPGLGQAEILKIKQSFDAFDPNGNGWIDPKLIKKQIERLGPKAQSQTIYQLIIDLDSDGSGYLSFKDFVYLMSTRITDNDSKEDIKKTFQLFDDDKTGYITIQSLRRIIKQLGEKIPEQEIEHLFSRADLDGDGVINEEEFYQLITHTTFV